MTSVVTRAFADLGSAVWLVGRAARDAVLGRAGPGLAEAMTAFVWRPLPLVALVGVLVGVILGLPVADIVKLARAEQTVGLTMSVIVVREIVPIVVGVFSAGWVSVGLAVRLERDGEAALAPSLLAVLMASPLHAVAAVMGVWLTIGAILAVGPLIPWPTYLDLTMGPAVYRGLWTGVIKTAVFTEVAVIAAAAVGSRQGGGLMRAPAAFAAGLVAVLSAVALWSWLD